MATLTYGDIVRKVRATFEHADARTIFEHIAIEIVMVGEGSGVFYFEVAERACVIEPYNYYDHDGVLTGDTSVFLKLASKELHVSEALEQGLLKYEGDMRKLKLCLDNLRLP